MAERKQKVSIPLTVLSVLIAVIVVFPIVWMVLSSFKPSGELFSYPLHLFSQDPTVEHYASVLAGGFMGYVKNSLFLAVVGTLITLVISSMCGYALAIYRFEIKYVNLVFGVFLLGTLIPGETLTVPQFSVISALGLYNNIWGVILPVVTTTPRMVFVRGHGETTLNLMSELVDELSHLTDITVVDLNLNTYEDCNVLCLINPKDNFSPYEIAQLEKFLSKGGRLFIALNHAIGLLDHPNNGYINSTGVEDMLEKKGLKIRNDFIIDNNCGVCNFEQQYGYLKFQRSVSFPYCPVITNFSKHTITYGLRSMLLMFASSIEQIKTPTPYIFTPLAQSSSISGVQQAPVCFDLEKQWTQRDFNRPHNIVAALLTNDDNNSAIVTITDADFLINQSAIDGHTDNITFALNSIEWLADNSGLIQLRNKFTTFPVLEPVGDTSREVLKYINFLLPILIILGIAFYRYKRNLRKREDRSHPGYID